MLIKRVLNNNAVISTNTSGVEVLLLGSGIAFKKRIGDEVEAESVEKTFVLRDREVKSKFTELLIDVPMEYIMVAEKIINYAKIKLGKNLSEIIYVNLTDHIHSSVERYRSDVILTNPLKWDVKRFYADEFDVGLKAVEIINQEFKVSLEDDEAAFIATHFVNAMLDSVQPIAVEMTQIVGEIVSIVKEYFHTEFDESSLDYYRFITHLKFFAQRLLSGEHYPDDDEELLEITKKKYKSAYACSCKVVEFIKAKYAYELSSSEHLYLMVHIARLVKNL